jgi:hypothetical protein
VNKHVQSDDHTSAIEEKKQERQHQLLITQALESQAARSRLPEVTQTRRVEVTAALMASGIPLEKLSSQCPKLRQVLETNNPKLAGATSMRQHVSVVNAVEKSTIVSELIPLKGKPVDRKPLAVFFDGATR